MGIGYIIAGVDKEKRGLHDMLCDTRVVYVKRIKGYSVNIPPAPPIPPVPPVPRQVTPPPDFEGSYRMVRPEEENKERDSQK